MRYSKEQIQCLKDNYPISNYKEIEKFFPGIQKKKIVALANRYGIKIDPEYRLKKCQEKNIGLTGLMSNGESAKIIKYFSSSNITVEFEDGTIVYNKNLVDFKRGKIGKSTEDRVGKTSIAKNGMIMKVITYRNYHDVDIQFEDGAVVEHKSYSSFKKGEIAYPVYSRLGEVKMANNGREMEIIEYRSFKDIDIKFKDGTIVKHRKYNDFAKGNIGYPIKCRVGNKKIAKNGMLMTVIAYRNSRDIDVQFEDGTIVKHREYKSFVKGEIANPNFGKSKIGEEVCAPNGHILKIIEYRNGKDIDVQFEDGTVVKHRDYYSFLIGNIALPVEKRVGKVSNANNGMKMRILNYRNSHDVDIEFEDGAIVKHKNYSNFLQGYIAYPRSDHVGEENFAKNGMKMEIIAYRNSADIDIRFEDGTIVEHRYYQNFKEGSVLFPLENRKGLEKIASNGLKMKIISYRSATDIDVQFEDGCIVRNKAFSDFKKGTIGHPAISIHRSLPEKIICYYIGKYFEYIPNYKPLWLLNNKKVSSNFRSEFDIFIPSKSVAIEYDGCRFHKNCVKDNDKDRCVYENKDIISLFIRVREEGCPVLENYDNLRTIDIKPFALSHHNSYIELSRAIQSIFTMLEIEDEQINVTNEIINYCRSDEFYVNELEMVNKLIK